MNSTIHTSKKKHKNYEKAISNYNVKMRCQDLVDHYLHLYKIASSRMKILFEVFGKFN